MLRVKARMMHSILRPQTLIILASARIGTWTLQRAIRCGRGATSSSMRAAATSVATAHTATPTCPMIASIDRRPPTK